jgi:small subunit ribosomal protein S14
MKVLYLKDKKRRHLFFLYEKNKLILKYIKNNNNLLFDLRKNAYFNLILCPLNSSFVRINNRCLLSNRSRGILTHFKVSRSFFKSLALNGYFPGVQKANW